jgi:hypothetical protein
VISLTAKIIVFHNPYENLSQNVNISVHLSTLSYKSMMLKFRPTQHSQEFEYIATMLTDVHRKIQIIVIKISLTEFPER